MHHNVRNSPNAPKSSLSPSFSAALLQHLKVLLPFSYDNVSLDSPLPRTPIHRSSGPGVTHPHLPSPISSQQHSGIHSTASQQSDAAPCLKGSLLSTLLCDNQQ